MPISVSSNRTDFVVTDDPSIADYTQAVRMSYKRMKVLHVPLF